MPLKTKQKNDIKQKKTWFIAGMREVQTVRQKGERDGPDLAVSQSPDKEGLLRAKEKNL